MKVYISPRAQELMDDPMSGDFMEPAIKEALWHGFDAIKKEDNPIYQGCQTRLWSDESCPLIVYHNKAGDYAIVCEKPLFADFFRVQSSYYENLLPLCHEMNLV